MNFHRVRTTHQYFVLVNSLNLSNEKQKSAQLDQYPQSKIENDLWDHDVHTILYWRREECQLLKYLELDPLTLYFLITKYLNLSNGKIKLVQLYQYISRKKPKSLWEQGLHPLQIWSFLKNLEIFIYKETFHTLLGFKVCTILDHFLTLPLLLLVISQKLRPG